MEKGLRKLSDPLDLSRVRRVQHGIKNESCAAECYLAIMHVSLRHCGLIVNATCPWVGARPNRLVFHPEEASCGMVEVECLYRLKDSDPSTAAEETSCLTLEDGIPHPMYFLQVLGQMALTGCNWAGFVVFTEKWVAVERIRFDQEEWTRVRQPLDIFLLFHFPN
ncbi:hypothetical protein HPB48_012778 [Haemaphysalis longicornis]|uniref:YqaJ viral recombinase domain-containing protein n=1 Tax=Haemaphysalis longicornis TaxID=44386 RepID=A0A9J6G2C5_HAELO|nr:hypothetical protein HPB48_012778 [Haemaphysalis longicornis]